MSVRGGWLIAARWLVLLKSKLLVHAEAGEPVPEVERLRESLVRAEQHRHARALAGWLERRPQLGWEVFARGAPEGGGEGDIGGGQAGDLLLACFDLLDEPNEVMREAGRPYAPPVLDVWPLAEALIHLRAWLHGHSGGGELGELMPGIAGVASASPLRRRSRLASAFLVGLELAKQGEARLGHDRAFWHLQVTTPPRTPSP